MNRGHLILLSVVLLGAGGFWMSSSQSKETSEQARALVASGAMLVDVRTPEEFADGHIPGAVNIPDYELERRLGQLGPPSSQLVIYCRSGSRSARAKRLLESKGYGQVFDLGAMSSW